MPTSARRPNGRRAAVDRRGPGLGEDPHTDPPHRPPRGRARGAGGELPRHHVYPPRRGGDAQRLARRSSPIGAGQVAIHTFHSLGLAFLREHASGRAAPRFSRRGRRRNAPRLLAETLEFRRSKARKAACARSPREADAARRSAESADEAADATRARCAGATGSTSTISSGSRPAPWRTMPISPRTIATVGNGSPSTSSRTRRAAVPAARAAGARPVRTFASSAIPIRRSMASAAPMRRASSASGRIIPVRRTVRLARNYRSSGTHRHCLRADDRAAPSEPDRRSGARHARAHHHPYRGRPSAPRPNPSSQTIEQMIGGHSFFSIDSGRAMAAAQASRSPTSRCSTARSRNRRRCARRSSVPVFLSRRTLTAARRTSRRYGHCCRNSATSQGATARGRAARGRRAAGRARRCGRHDRRCSALPRSPIVRQRSDAPQGRGRARPPTRSSGIRAPTACRC